MARTIVGVLRGGTSNEYNLSLKTGAAEIAALPEEKYDVRDILVDKKGYWYSRGLPTTPARILSQLDVVVNALHGGVGEDGTVQRILDRAGVPYTGSKAVSSAMALNKIRAREIMQSAGVPIPQGLAFTLDSGMNVQEMARKAFESFAAPYIVKPASEGAGYGIEVAMTIIELPEKLADVLDKYGAAVVEEYLSGDEAHVGVMESFRGEELYTFPPVHVELPTGGRYLEPTMHEGATAVHHVPSDFSDQDKQTLAAIARAAHRALALSHFSRVDLMVTKRGPYVLEVNAIPGLYPGAALPPALESVGSSIKEFLEHAIGLTKK